MTTSNITEPVQPIELVCNGFINSPGLLNDLSFPTGVWHKIEAGRSGREGYLKLDSQVTKGTAPPGLTTLDVDHIIYLGNNYILRLSLLW